MDSIPIDLFQEILSRLPAESIARCRCVSKLWVSKICRPDFTERFLTRSPARPRLLFVIGGDGGEWSIYSSPHHSPYEKSSLVVAADYHMKFSEDMRLEFCGHASGFVCFRRMRVSKEEENLMHVICNPSTGQCKSLPKLRRGINSYSFLGFDPIDEQFKVLFIADPSSDDDNKFMTLGTGEMSWRKIQCPLNHYPPRSEAICINGVLYYLAKIDGFSSVIVCFDVRSEKFRFIDLEFIYDMPDKLINYNGKLGVNDWDFVDAPTGTANSTFQLLMWVLEDVEKQEWSKLYVYNLPCKSNFFVVAGVTSTGEIVSSEFLCTHKPFDVFYFNIERNTLQSVKIQGNHEVFDIHNQKVNIFVDHVENFKLIL